MSNEEYEELRYGLKHSLARNLKEKYVFPFPVATFDEVKWKGLCKDNLN